VLTGQVLYIYLNSTGGYMNFSKKYLTLAAAAAILFCIGCAPSIRLEVLKPAEVNMKGAKKLAVMDYGFPMPNKPMGVDDLLKAAFAKMVGVQMHEQETPEMKLAKCATSKTASVLASTQYFTILTPTELSRTFAGGPEQPPLSAVDIGKKAGAQSIILGEIEHLSSDDESFVEERKKDNGNKEVIRKIKRTVTVRMSYRVIETETGSLLATKTLDGKIDQIVLERNRGELSKPDELGCQVLDKILPAMARQLAPYKVVQNRILMKDKTKNPEFERALKFIKGNMYSNAYDIFTQIYQTSGNISAGFNAAIMKEAMGDLEAAYNEMNALASKTAEPEVIREVNRLKNAWEDQKKAASQI
jgi:hypothetical protein